MGRVGCERVGVVRFLWEVGEGVGVGWLLESVVEVEMGERILWMLGR